MINRVSLRAGDGKGATGVVVRSVDIEPVVNAGGTFALTYRAGKGKEKRRNAFFKLKPGGNVDEVIKHRREHSKLIKKAEFLGLVTFGDVFKPRIG